MQCNQDNKVYLEHSEFKANYRHTGISSYNELIGIEYHREGLDEGDDTQKWVPISWCIPDKVHVNQCDINQSSSDSTCDYLALNDSVEAIFRRAFKDITMLKKQQQQSEESCSESKYCEFYEVRNLYCALLKLLR